MHTKHTRLKSNRTPFFERSTVTNVSNEQTPSTLAKLSLPVGKLETRAITLKAARFEAGSTLVPHAANDTDTQRFAWSLDRGTSWHPPFANCMLCVRVRRDCPFYSFYALATTTHGSPSSSPEVRAVLTFHVVLRAAHLQQTARAVCANSHTLGEQRSQGADARCFVLIATVNS